MENIQVKTQSKEYTIYLKESFNDITNAFESINIKNRKVCIVTDNNVEKLYIEEISDMLKPICKELYSYSFKAGEESKSLETISDMYKFFLENRLDRKSVIVALGGGVVGDMAGFAASTYMRGISFVQIPTTLLAQVDSSVGGKTGVDFMGSKNIIGAFYQPEFVYINVNTINTLPKDEFYSGMAEVIKYGLIKDIDFYNFILQNKDSIKNLNIDYLKKIVYKSCTIKADVVSQDEKETGLREILNFGHTFGHSIESLSKFKLLHGQCVGIGMISALYLSKKVGIITEKEIECFKELLMFFDLPIEARNFSVKDIYEQMFLDKKAKNNQIDVILLKNLGEAYTLKGACEEDLLYAINKVAY